MQEVRLRRTSFPDRVLQLKDTSDEGPKMWISDATYVSYDSAIYCRDAQSGPSGKLVYNYVSKIAMAATRVLDLTPFVLADDLNRHVLYDVDPSYDAHRDAMVGPDSDPSYHPRADNFVESQEAGQVGILPGGRHDRGYAHAMMRQDEQEPSPARLQPQDMIVAVLKHSGSGGVDRIEIPFTKATYLVQYGDVIFSFTGLLIPNIDYEPNEGDTRLRLEYREQTPPTVIP